MANTYLSYTTYSPSSNILGQMEDSIRAIGVGSGISNKTKDNKSSMMLNEVFNFRVRKDNNNFNKYDEPGTFYFKILFYFNNEDEISGSSGLLGTEGETCALNYLLNNDEIERATYLKNFIYLLSEISTNSPWYFQSLEGLDKTQERGYLKDFKVSEETSQITIKCLQDSVDTRISTLLSLYRSACFSHVWKKEIVPANLRKFDMGIYIFQSPINGDSYSNVNGKIAGVVRPNEMTDDNEFTNSKYIEFHNCEIALESLETTMGTPDNTKGFEIEPSIIIKYDDCYTSGWNEWMCKTIGDMVQLDLTRKFIPDPSRSLSDEEAKSAFTEFVSKVIDNTKGKVVTKVRDLVAKAYLGNVYGLSLANINNIVDLARTGDVFTAAYRTVHEKNNIETSIKNKTIINDMIPSLVDYRKMAQNRDLGNIAKNIIRNL